MVSNRCLFSNFASTNQTHRNDMKKFIAWISASNRYKHLIGGVAIGALSDSDYCAALCGIGVAGALEYKDKAHGGAWDWCDFAMTLACVIVGRLIRIAVCGK